MYKDIVVSANRMLIADDEDKKRILEIVKSSDNFPATIKQLEEENLIWCFVDTLDDYFKVIEDDQSISQAEKECILKRLENFSISVNKSLKLINKDLGPGLKFTAYQSYDDKSDISYKIRFQNEGSEIEISRILKDGGNVYEISLGSDSIVIANKENRNERHYRFTGSELCKVTINWQAKVKDAKGKETQVNCSIAFLTNKDGVQEIVGEPMFTGIIDKQEMLKLVKQNKEVFINGDSLYDAITKNKKSQQDVNKLLQREAREDSVHNFLYINGKKNINSQANNRNSFSSSASVDIGSISGIDTGFSNSKSLLLGDSATQTHRNFACNKGYSEGVDIEFENDGTRPKSPYSSALLGRNLLYRRNSLGANREQPVESKIEQLTKSITELQREVETLKQKNRRLITRNEEIVEEGDEYRLDLEKAEEKIVELKRELKSKDEASKKRIEELLAEQDEICKENDREVKKSKQEVESLKKVIRSKSDEILSLTTQIVEQGGEVQQLQTEYTKMDEALKKEKEENEKLKKGMEEAIERTENKYAEKSREQNKKLIAKKHELTQVKDELEQQQLNAQRLSTRFYQMEIRVSTLQKKEAENQDKIRELEKEQEKVRQLEQANIALRETNTKSNERIKELEAKVARVEQEEASRSEQLISKKEQLEKQLEQAQLEIQNQVLKEAKADSSAQTILTFENGGRDYFDLSQNIIGVELNSLSPDTELSETIIGGDSASMNRKTI